MAQKRNQKDINQSQKKQLKEKSVPSNCRKQLNLWLNKIDIKGKVLNVGGYSNPLNSEYKILDYMGGDYVYDLNYEIKGLPQFDTVLCFEVMEFIWNPYQAFQNLHRFLKDNGTLYISFHFLFPHHDPRDKDYLRYTLTGIKKLMEETGFEALEIIPRKAKHQENLIKWCEEESKIVVNKGDIGYLIKGRKKVA